MIGPPTSALKNSGYLPDHTCTYKDNIATYFIKISYGETQQIQPPKDFAMTKFYGNESSGTLKAKCF
jgi:hypothetical protein